MSQNDNALEIEKTSRTGQAMDELAGVLEHIRLFDLVVALTVYTLFRISHTPVDLIATFAFGSLCFFRRLRESAGLWVTFASVGLLHMYLQFHHYEDHCFLVMYWCMALGLSRLGNQSNFVMKRNARLLIGLCFAFGLVWKIISPEFHQGELFEFKLLYDHRFAEMVTVPVANLEPAMEQANLEAYQQLRTIDVPDSSVAIQVPGRVPAMATLMTWWTIVIEGALAAAFLFTGRLWSQHRDGILMFFMASTYVVVPVMGFASLFTAMGVAQANSGRTKVAYLLLHVAMFTWYSLRIA